jgi:hypothetical protein
MTSNPPSTSRDIEALLITGAGASVDFGKEDGRLPLMPQWSDALVKKLGTVGNYLDATGLENDLNGAEFELRLGRFLREASALRQIRRLLELSLNLQQLQFQLNREQILGWHDAATFHLTEIENLIHQSLYELFGPTAIDSFAARAPYEALLSRLRLGPRSSLVCATTNYDPILEGALDLMGRLPDFGVGAPVIGSHDPVLQVEGLLDGLPRYTPVLHLHGRVGWYRREADGNQARSTGAATHERGYGSPVVVLPDPEKAYQDVLLIDLWREFATALRRAQKVFILGHSLNDATLVQAIRDNVDPLHRVAVGVLATPNDPEVALPNLEAAAHEHLEGSKVIPLTFGRRPSFADTAFVEWQQSLEQLARDA